MIDTHLHFWNPFDLEYFWLEPHSDLNRAYLPEHFDAEYRAAGVTGAVFVQASHDPRENTWALELANRCPWLLGVVGWVDLERPDPHVQLETLGTLETDALHRICTANPQQIYGLELLSQGVNL